MNANEEPTSTSQPTGADDELVTFDIDDVEGHGLREVAAGLGAAAVLAGGGTAMAASVTTVHPSMPGTGTGAISNPVKTVDRMTDQAIATARTTRDNALAAAVSAVDAAGALAGAEVATAVATAGTLVTGAESVAGATKDAAVRIADGAATAVRDDVTTAAHLAGSVAGTATSTAATAVRSTKATVEGVANVQQTAAAVSNIATSTAADAVRKVATVVQLTTSTVNALETTIVATVSSLNPQVTAGAHDGASSGWVTFSLGGQTIASVQLSNGQATVTVRTGDLPGHVLQAVYSGDSVNASSLRSIAL